MSGGCLLVGVGASSHFDLIVGCSLLVAKVVAALLLRSGGALQLVDASDRLPQLKRLPGVAKWQVIDDEMQLLHSFEQTQSSKKRRAKLNQRGGSSRKSGGGKGAGTGTR
eukprot:4650197-Pleurochrysis_carterae.AAC.1